MRGNQKNKVVYKKSDGSWVIKETNTGKVLTYSSQKTAVDAASIQLRRHGGGEVIVRGKDGRILEKNSFRVPQAYQVFFNGKGSWSVKKVGAVRAIKVFDEREKAIKFARRKSQIEGNDLVIYNKDGIICSSNSF